jgi:arylsulfatase A-like enzyme
MDESVGRIIDKVESLGIADKTIFVYVSDHGEMLYEHGALEKHCFYEASVHVPLIISCPALLPQGIQTDYLTALIDLMPTMLKLTGNPIPQGLEGESVVHGIFGESNPDKAVFSEFHQLFPCRMIKTEDWKYAYNHGHSEQLYDVKKDPLEVNNLAYVGEYAQIKESLKQRVLDGWNVALD